MNGSGFDHQDKTRNGSAAISFCQQPSRSQPYMIGCNYLTGDDATFIAHRTPRVAAHPGLPEHHIEYVAESLELAPAELSRARRICYSKLETPRLRKSRLFNQITYLGEDILT